MAKHLLTAKHQRDLLQCQKRPTTVSKETYYRGSIVKVSCMAKHLPTAKHQRAVVGCENVEVVAHYKYVDNYFINNN
jgi:hypothetical protein